MNPAVFNKKIGEFSLGWRGYLWRFAVMIQGKDAALQIHFPHSLRGLFKGAAQPLVALQELRFILLEGGNVGGGYQHHGVGIVVLNPAGPNLPPKPGFAIRRDPMGIWPHLNKIFIK